MRTIHRLIEAKKAEREENGEAGFSLIELIIVVVILGILVAIAIPLIGNLQKSALESAAQAAAANAATQVSAQIANGDAVALPADAASTKEFTFTHKSGAAPTKLDDVCVVATSKDDGTIKGESGPGC